VLRQSVLIPQPATTEYHARVLRAVFIDSATLINDMNTGLARFHLNTIYNCRQPPPTTGRTWKTLLAGHSVSLCNPDVRVKCQSKNSGFKLALALDSDTIEPDTFDPDQFRLCRVQKPLGNLLASCLRRINKPDLSKAPEHCADVSSTQNKICIYLS